MLHLCLNWGCTNLGGFGVAWFSIARKSQEPRERGSGGVKSTGVSQSVRETSRDEFQTRDLELLFSERSLTNCLPHT